MNTAITMARPSRPASSTGVRLSSIVTLPTAALSRTGHAVLAQRQRAIVAGELQIAGAHGAGMFLRVDRTLPIDGAAREPRIVLLVIQQRHDLKLPRAERQTPAHRIAHAGARRVPAPHGCEHHLIGPEAMHLPLGVAQRAAGPVRLSLPAANPERHDGATVIQVESHPVPAVRRAIEVLTGPLVIEPGLAAHDVAARRACDAAAHPQVRFAVVIAGRLRRGTLAAVAGNPVEQHRLRDFDIQVQGKVLGEDMSLVARTAALELPVIDPDAGVAHSRLSQAQSGAPDALILPQVAARRITDGAVGDQQLTGRKCTG